jgi:ribosomal protein S18 acetylase RimI-like enzyme
LTGTFAGKYACGVGAITVRRAALDDRAALAEILAAAFASDPLALWVLEGRRDPERDLRVMFSAILGEALKQRDHHVYITNDSSGAALWFDVGRWKMPVPTKLKLWPTAVRTGFSSRRAIRLDFAMQKAHPKTPHHYLQMIGTRPERQGKGAGTMLISTLLEACDREKLGAYLESSNPENLPFYGRHGFEGQPSFPLPKGCPPCTPMWRDPELVIS